MAKRMSVSIEQLRPLQATVGLLEVDAKRKCLVATGATALKEFLKSVPIPTVIGKHDRHYVIDHHHLARALWDAVIERRWVHPYDEHCQVNG